MDARQNNQGGPLPREQEHPATVAHRMRLAAEMTQEEAAAALGISLRSWLRFELQERGMPERIVREFCSRTALDAGAFLPTGRGPQDEQKE